ncbi:MAG: B12-binding domain-containing radical SAM protein [Candidatus Helarchaeota archaeon]
MKILLLHPGIHYFREGNKLIVKKKTVITDHTLPLGILYIAEVLKRNNIEIEVFDHAVINLSVDKLVKWIIKNDFDLVGLSVMGGSFITAIEISKRLKKLNPNIIIVFGGVQSTLCHDRIMEKYNQDVDYCVRGEGEYTFLELIEALRKNKEIKDVRGITYYEHGIVKFTEDRPELKNLDDLPIPDRSILTKKFRYLLGGKVSPLISSRGCIYNCRFCSCGVLYKRRLRFRSVENVIKELIYLENEGFKEINIVDDCFTINVKRVHKICEQIKKEKLDLKWHCLCRTNIGDYNMYRHMATAGCATVSLGIESANQRILDYYDKKSTVENAKISVKNANKARIPNVYGGFIIGAPGETVQEVLNTIKFGLKLNLSFMQFQLLNVLPKTQIFDEFVRKGWLDPSQTWEQPVIAADVCPTAVPKKILEKIVEVAYIHFVGDSKRIIKEYLRSMRAEYRFQIFKNIPEQLKKVLSKY